MYSKDPGSEQAPALEAADRDVTAAAVAGSQTRGLEHLGAFVAAKRAESRGEMRLVRAYAGTKAAALEWHHDTDGTVVSHASVIRFDSSGGIAEWRDYPAPAG